MLVLSSSIGLSHSPPARACNYVAPPRPEFAYLVSAFLAPAVSTVNVMLFLRQSSFTGEDLVIILGLAIVFTFTLLGVSPDIRLSLSLFGEAPSIPEAPV